MFLKHKKTEKLVEVLAVTDLVNPNHGSIVGRFHAGEEMQDPEKFSKSDVVFPSGEALPRCWIDPHYREA